MGISIPPHAAGPPTAFSVCLATSRPPRRIAPDQPTPMVRRGNARRMGGGGGKATNFLKESTVEFHKIKPHPLSPASPAQKGKKRYVLENFS